MCTWGPGAHSRECVGHCRRRFCLLAAWAICSLRTGNVMLNAGVLVLGLTARPFAGRGSQPNRRRRMASDDVAIRLEPCISATTRMPTGHTRALREGRGPPEDERQDATELAEAAAGRRLTPGEVSSFWVRETMEFVRSQPGAWLTLMGKKASFCGTAPSSSIPRARKATKTGHHCFSALAHVGHFGVLVPLAVLGVFATWKDRSRAGVVLRHGRRLRGERRGVLRVGPLPVCRWCRFLILFAAAGLASLTSFLRTASGCRRLRRCRSTIGHVMIVTNRPMLSADAHASDDARQTSAWRFRPMSGSQEAETHYRRAHCHSARLRALHT